LDDRILFNERRAEERAKVLSGVVEAQKENGVGRLSERVRALQTEMFAALRESQSKMEAKANAQDLERQSAAWEERLRQLTEHVRAKSDKL
jgi:hypothetical protein